MLDYAARYPQQVAGIVLLDTTPPTAFTSLPDYPAIYDMLTTMTGLFPGLARLGVTQLINGVSAAECPPRPRAKYAPTHPPPGRPAANATSSPWSRQ